MKLMNTSLLITATLVSAAILSTPTCVAAQDDSSTLTIGSVAPPLDIEHWIHDGDGKFKHINKFEKGKVYMIEFWATWCGPCISAMPRVVELQTQYADKGVQVISISKESLETIDKFLDRPVRGSKDDEETYRKLTSSYCLTSDPDRSSDKDYMVASKQNGIPCSFLVGKTGHIEWIGHPMSIDEPLAQVVNDSWDRDAFLEEFKAEQLADEVLAEVRQQMQLRKPEQALKIVEQYIAESKSSASKDRFRALKFQVLASSPAFKDLLAPYIIETLADEKLSPSMTNMIGWNVYQLSVAKRLEDKAVLEAAVIAASNAAERSSSNQASIWDTVAHLQAALGDVQAALKTQTKAVELASPEERDTLEEYLLELTSAAKDAAEK